MVMRIREKWIQVGLLAVVVTLLALLGINPATKAQASSTLADGEYTVPATFVKSTDTSSTSAAAQYFATSATVTAKNGTYDVTLPIKESGQQYIKTVTVNDQDDNVVSGTNLVFSVTSTATQIPITFTLD